jgi:hypothetical protein
VGEGEVRDGVDLGGSSPVEDQPGLAVRLKTHRACTGVSNDHVAKSFSLVHS